MLSFKGKIVLVTGAGKGIGRGLVKKLVEQGASVVALSKTPEHLASLKEELPSITTLAVDLADIDTVRRMVRDHGPYHCLVNNAAVAKTSPFLSVTEEHFDWMFNVNVKAAIVVGQEVARGMIDNKIKGSIVNVSSQASQMGLRDHTIYAGTKGALDSVTKVMALELGAHGIRTNCVNPTVVMTDMSRIGWSEPVKAKAMLDRIPLGRFAEVEDVVNTIVFLLSDEAGMINGALLPVDGGALAV